jgi:hypothetical protein
VGLESGSWIGTVVPIVPSVWGGIAVDFDIEGKNKETFHGDLKLSNLDSRKLQMLIVLEAPYATERRDAAVPRGE